MNLPEFDSLKRAFDPKKFLPRLDALGRWINARAGRRAPKKTAKKTARTSPPMSQPAAPVPPAETAPAPAADPAAIPAPDTIQTPAPAPSFADIEKAAGKTAPVASEASADVGDGRDIAPELSTSGTIIGIIQTALVLVGEEEGVLSPAEVIVLRAPLERVLKKYDIGADVLPAEVDLAVALAGIIIVRLKKPKTATWFVRAKHWLAGKVTASEGRKLAARVEQVNQS